MVSIVTHLRTAMTLTMLTGGWLVAAPARPQTSTLEPVVLQRRVFARIPYLYVAVRRPRRTILLIHGGPGVPAFDASDESEGYLARRFRARVIKPVFYGSTERSPLDRPINVALHGEAADRARSQVIRAIEAARGGMPIAVREVRRFLLHWDARTTIVLGESFGARLAALSARVPHRSRLILMAPALWTPAEVVRAEMAGTYTQGIPVDPVRTDNGPLAMALFDTPARRRQLDEAVSLAYYRPWQNADLGSILRGTPGKVTVIVGLRDRIGMITGREWLRLRARAPASTHLCVDPLLKHEPPWLGSVAARCFTQAMRL